MISEKWKAISRLRGDVREIGLISWTNSIRPLRRVLVTAARISTICAQSAWTDLPDERSPCPSDRFCPVTRLPARCRRYPR